MELIEVKVQDSIDVEGIAGVGNDPAASNPHQRQPSFEILSHRLRRVSSAVRYDQGMSRRKAMLMNIDPEPIDKGLQKNVFSPGTHGSDHYKDTMIHQTLPQALNIIRYHTIPVIELIA